MTRGGGYNQRKQSRKIEGEKMSNLITKYDYPMEVKLRNFEKYVTRQSLSRFIARYELFKMIKDTQGSIIECGVHWGGGIMAYAKLCAGFDLLGLDRKVIGFDTFEGFPHINVNDKKSAPNQLLKVGEFQSFDQIEDELRDCIKEFDENRFINDWEKIELIKGDACETIPRYIEDNPHTMISLLYLDFDLYEPTKVALEYLAPRVVKGGIIAFDEINAKAWAGETIAALEYFGDFNKCNFRKFPFATGHSYLIVE